MRALLIGEAWGRNERDYKHAFVGQSGQELARMGGESGMFPPLTRPCRHCNETVTFGRCENCGVYNNVSPLEMVKFWAQTRNNGVGITNVFKEHPDKDNVELFLGNKLDDVDLSRGIYK